MILRASLYLNALLLIACLLFAGLWRYEVGRKHAILAAEGKAQLQAQIAARTHEQQDAANSAKIADAYEQGKRDAEAAGKSVTDGLRAGTVRLRKQWQGCESRLSDPPAGAAEPDATAADRNESAGRIVRAAREADEQIKGLQDILRSERNVR